MRAFPLLLLLFFSAILCPAPAAEGPFSGIGKRIKAIVDPQDPTSLAGSLLRATGAYCFLHGKLPACREHLEEGLRCADLPTTGLDGLHDLEFTPKSRNHVYITGRYKKGGVEAPIRINLQVTMEGKELKGLAKRSVMPPAKAESKS